MSPDFLAEMETVHRDGDRQGQEVQAGTEPIYRQGQLHLPGKETLHQASSILGDSEVNACQAS